MQYSQEFRDKVIERVLSGRDSQETLAGEFGIGRSTIQYWLREHRRVHAQPVSKKDKRASSWSVSNGMDSSSPHRIYIDAARWQDRPAIQVMRRSP